MLALLLLFVAFVLLSGIMAAIDAAFLSVTRPEISEMMVEGKWGTRRLDLARRNMTRSLVVIVILTNTVNVLGPVLVTGKAAEVFGTSALTVTIVCLTLGTIVFSEIIPKALGNHYAPVISRIAAPLVHSCGFALFPLVRSLEWLAEGMKRGRRQIGTEAQIRSLVAIGRRAGLIEGDEMKMIRRAFILNDRTAADIMTPLTDVAGINASATVREAARFIRQHRYSRYPLFGETEQDVKGLLMARDVLEALADRHDEKPVLSLARPAVKVEASTLSDSLLVLFRDLHVHLAVVRDRGRTIGVVSLEDVLEELVGEIEDEKDVETLKNEG